MPIGISHTKRPGECNPILPVVAAEIKKFFPSIRSLSRKIGVWAAILCSRSLAAEWSGEATTKTCGDKAVMASNAEKKIPNG